MNVIYHHRTLGDGAEAIHISEIVKALREQGHPTHLVSLVGDEMFPIAACKTLEKGWKSWVKRLPPSFFEMGEMAYNLQGYQMVSKAIRKHCADFVYDRYVSYNHSAIAAAHHHGISCILEVNSPYAIQKRDWETVRFPRLLSYSEGQIFRAADAVITVSTPLRNIVESYGVNSHKVIVMPNGVDLDKFKPESSAGQQVRKELGLMDKLVLGFLGILRPWHGLDLFLRAFQGVCKEFSNAALLMVGDGPMLQELRMQALAMGIQQQVHFIGRIPHEKVPEYVYAMDIAVSPRATFYSSPMKIIEYMAMRRTIVAPDMENIRDILKDNETGLLFQPEDAQSLAAKLLQACRNEGLRVQLGQNARRKAESNFTWRKNAARVIDIISALNT